MLREVLEALSIGLTLPALIFCGWVLSRYHGTFSYVFTGQFSKAQPRDWIAGGIFIGFLGELLDGAYWGLAWLAHFYGWPFTNGLISWGVVANIPSREIMVVMAAYGHIRASMMVQPGFSRRELNVAVGAIIASGFIAFGVLMLTKWW